METLSSALQSNPTSEENAVVEKTDMQKLLYFEVHEINKDHLYLKHKFNDTPSEMKESLIKSQKEKMGFFKK